MSRCWPRKGLDPKSAYSICAQLTLFLPLPFNSIISTPTWKAVWAQIKPLKHPKRKRLPHFRVPNLCVCACTSSDLWCVHISRAYAALVDLLSSMFFIAVDDLWNRPQVGCGSRAYTAANQVASSRIHSRTRPLSLLRGQPLLFFLFCFFLARLGITLTIDIAAHFGR